MNNVMPLQSKAVVVTMLMGAITVSLNNSALNPALPELMQVFSIGPALVSWVLAAFMLAMSFTLAVTGYLSQNYGQRRIYLLGLGLFTLGSIMGTYAVDIYSLIVARSIQGIASGLILPLSLVFLFSVTAPERRGRITSLWASVIMMTLAIGPVFGGFILAVFDWSLLFALNIPISLITFVIACYALKADQSNLRTAFDWLGFALISLSIGLFMWGSHRIESWQDLSQPLYISAIVLSIISLFFFVWQQLKHPEPLLNLRLFKHRQYSLSVVIATIQMVAMFGCMILSPVLIQQIFNFSPMWTGVALFVTAVSASISLYFAAKVLDAFGPKPMVTLGLAITAIALLGLSQISSSTHTLSIILLFMLLRGIGIGLSVTPVTTAGLQHLVNDDLVQATSMSDLVRRTASTTAVVIVAVYLEVRSHHFIQSGVHTSLSLHSAIDEAFVLMGLLVILAIPFSFFLKQYKTPELNDAEFQNDTPQSLINK